MAVNGNLSHRPVQVQGVLDITRGIPSVGHAVGLTVVDVVFRNVQSFEMIRSFDHRSY